MTTNIAHQIFFLLFAFCFQEKGHGFDNKLGFSKFSCSVHKKGHGKGYEVGNNDDFLSQISLKKYKDTLFSFRN